MSELPKTQCAVQLVGAGELVLNRSKALSPPGPRQIVCRVEAVGLCFSDLKLLKQFSGHPRKTEVASGIEQQALSEIPSYVPGDKPTVPGHETVVRIVAAGEKVKQFTPGQRYLVETDYRWLPTAQSNAAFGYNFEGALQEYVLMDERVITSPEGESMLILVPEDLSASAVALVEPLACVENAYIGVERKQIKAGGEMLIAADAVVTTNDLACLFRQYDRPGRITWFSQYEPPKVADVVMETCPDLARLKDASFDDVIYMGSNPNRVEALFAKVGPKGLLNIVLCGGKFGRDIMVTTGLVHYGGMRITGTAGYEPTDSMKHIPDNSAIRKGNKINILGAGGPMGTMHVIRNIWQRTEGIKIFAGDTDEHRLALLSKIVEPIAKENGIAYSQYNPAKNNIPEPFDYTVIVASVPELVGASVKTAARGGIINVFAGISSATATKVDLDSYIEKQLYFIGTSGSTLEDMKSMLSQLEAGRIDTNVSVAAVCGLDGVCDGIKAVENRMVAGKVVVYPACKGLGLTPLSKLADKMPDVATCLNNGLWTAQAEKKLVERYSSDQAS